MNLFGLRNGVAHGPSLGQQGTPLSALRYIGAGPLEDLLPQSQSFLEMVAAAARDDERLQFALSNVCLDEFEEEGFLVWERWMAIRKELNLDAKLAAIYPERYPG